jgi:hypothetical protein
LRIAENSELSFELDPESLASNTNDEIRSAYARRTRPVGFVPNNG